MMNTVSRHFGWQTALVAFPVMFAIHLSYRRYFAETVEASRSTGMARTATAGA
jgi:hypothetical protein